MGGVEEGVEGDGEVVGGEVGGGGEGIIWMGEGEGGDFRMSGKKKEEIWMG